MRFNRFIFDNYLATEEGKKALAFFKRFENVVKNKRKSAYFSFLKHISILPVEKWSAYEELKRFSSLSTDFDFPQKCLYYEKILQNEDMTADEVFEEARKGILDALEDEKSMRQQVAFIRGYSVIFYISAPRFFFPYYFETQFPVLENICAEFGIPLPPLPPRRDYKKRLFYYFDLCKAFYDFRQQFSLAPEEFCVFLYYFASHCMEPFALTEDLPEPSKVYICGASKEDSEWLKGADFKTISRWAGNINMLPGDIMLLYEVRPAAAIRSVWRCVSAGFDDPFEYFTPRVWVSRMIRVPPVTIGDLRSDSVWKEKGLVRASMQGVSGTPCTKVEYDAFLKMLESKGFDTSVLPRIACAGLPCDVELNVEKDVEEKLLEPLLKRLGYSEKDWVRQLPVRMGRGERNYPDYALLPKGMRGEETARFLWEAKFTVSSKRQLWDAFLQAKSYAMRLRSGGFGMVAKEGIWLSFEKDSFQFGKVKSYSWADLENPDVLSEVRMCLRK